jgi:hypothetical protein
MSPKPILGHIVLFEHPEYRGAHRHIFAEERNMEHSDDYHLSHKVSSFVVLAGVWKFYRKPNFEAPHDGEFGPGQYEFTGSYGIPSDMVRSLRCVRAG